MNNENVEGTAVSGDVDVGSVSLSSNTESGVSSNTGDSEQLNPNLKPGVPVEDIDGLTEERARELGLFKSPQDYAAEKAAEVAALEAMPHADMISDATHDLVSSVRGAIMDAVTLGDVTNQVYGKFMNLGMAEQAETLRNLNTNVHFNKIIELLEQVKAHAILLEVEMGYL